ncbi:MAG: alpha-E domain-containing protein [Gammaproteobacteria bacterium]|nr:alpha-E domain-containing protein [Gammaproteobacteria bacterium]
MLSRVAERIYWMARYIERSENIARMIKVNSYLLLDLPRKARLGWGPLIDIMGAGELFYSIYKEPSERNVVKFLIGDERNPSSILMSLKSARENARTIRDIIPREAWELINELYLLAKNEVQTGMTQNHRQDYLDSIIGGAQQNTGLLAGTMTHDEGYDFLRMGRNLERADMTTRLIDVRSANLLPDQDGALSPFDNIQWMSVLKSLTAYQMYRREMQGPVRRGVVLDFLFKSREFPRAIYHTLGEVESCLSDLPHNEAPLRSVTHLQRLVKDAEPAKLPPPGLHAFIDDLQLELDKLHGAIADTYFKTTIQAAASA